MESLFFNITDSRYKVTMVNKYLKKVDISNGVLFFDAKMGSGDIKIQNLDRMIIIVIVKEGEFVINDALAQTTELLHGGNIAIYGTSRQKITLNVEKSNAFILFIADFFLKRYLCGQQREPIDFLYHKIQDELSLEQINLQPIDALTLYIVKKLLSIDKEDKMQSLRAEHHLIELMVHRFALLDIIDEKISKENLILAQRAKAILLQNFIHPPTIKELAHLCATNESKLKKVFKLVYNTTLHTYVQKLRLAQANLLLKEESLTIGEIAKRVGYKHQGYFSKLFYKSYGVYPVALLH